MSALAASTTRSARRRIALLTLALSVFAAPLLSQELEPARVKRLRAPDVDYEPSAPNVARAMLRMAEVSANDVVYDLGCGDGRIAIMAAREFGARAVCVDIDPKRTMEADANVRKAGVAGRVDIRNEDLFETEIVGASVVTLFLWPEVNIKLRSRLLRELLPGTRVVSHFHDMGDWTPQEPRTIRAGNRERSLYLWVIPPR